MANHHWQHQKRPTLSVATTVTAMKGPLLDISVSNDETLQVDQMIQIFTYEKVYPSHY